VVSLAGICKAGGEMEGRSEGNGQARERTRKPRQRREEGGGSLPARRRWPGSTDAAAAIPRRR
jgi:hypothetical protein